MSPRDGFDSVHASQLLAGQNRALELALRGAPLAEVLEVLVHTAETQSDGSFLGSILLLDENGRHLRHGAAPSLPAAYNEAIDGIAIGPAVGSCGTAAHFGHAIVVTDIARNPLWADFRELALAHGLRACWSTPFVSRDGKVLGTLALYYREARGPSEHDRETVRLVGNTAALVVENARLTASLRDLHARARLAADAGGLGFFTWDVDKDVVSWQNDRPYEIFGLDAAQAPINASRFVAEFLDPQDRAAFEAAVERALQEGSPFHFSGRFRHAASGALRRVDIKGRLDLEARQRGVARLVGIVADTTAQRGAAAHEGS